MSLGSQFIFVNGKDRVSGTASNFNINLVDLDQNNDNDQSLTIQNLSIPYSFYNITDLNNTVSVGTTETFTIPKGNYSATTLAAQFISSANSVIPGVSMTYSTTTGKFSYGATGDFSMTIAANQPFFGLSEGIHHSVSYALVSDQYRKSWGPSGTQDTFRHSKVFK